MTPPFCNLEVIGEAVKNLSRSFGTGPEIPSIRIAGLRDMLIDNISAAA